LRDVYSTDLKVRKQSNRKGLDYFIPFPLLVASTAVVFHVSSCDYVCVLSRLVPSKETRLSNRAMNIPTGETGAEESFVTWYVREE
jgi:hypothetical protein